VLNTERNSITPTSSGRVTLLNAIVSMEGFWEAKISTTNDDFVTSYNDAT